MKIFVRKEVESSEVDAEVFFLANHFVKNDILQTRIKFSFTNCLLIITYLNTSAKVLLSGKIILFANYS